MAAAAERFLLVRESSIGGFLVQLVTDGGTCEKVWQCVCIYIERERDGMS